jgi:electron transport complex protein RnfD
MRNVVGALLPICFYGVWMFGISAAALLATTTISCLATEHVFCRVTKRRSSLGDFSATITGLLLGLTLPPGLPLWMAAIGGIIAIAPGKMLFGGLGFNLFNPALVGRAFLQAAFPVAITTYTTPLSPHRFTEFIYSSLALPLMKARHPIVDALSGATPLVSQKFDHLTADAWWMFWGGKAGSLGESSVVLVLLCGAYLIARRFMDWRIPAAVFGAAALEAALFHWSSPERYPGVLFMLFSGGLALGAMFMATDPAGAPSTRAGKWIYGALIGIITVLIRLKGGLAEGVMYAILLANALTPLLDNVTQPRAYGARLKGIRA